MGIWIILAFSNFWVWYGIVILTFLRAFQKFLRIEISQLVFVNTRGSIPANCPYLIANIPILSPPPQKKREEKSDFTMCRYVCKHQYVVMFRKVRNIPIFKDFPLICPYFLGFRVAQSTIPSIFALLEGHPSNQWFNHDALIMALQTRRLTEVKSELHWCFLGRRFRRIGLLIPFNPNLDFASLNSSLWPP